MNDLHNNAKTLLMGFLWALRECDADPRSVDTWGDCGGHDINICGADYAANAPANGLIAIVYPIKAGGELGDALFSIALDKVE